MLCWFMLVIIKMPLAYNFDMLVSKMKLAIYGSLKSQS